jgi:hypothetical protein
MRSAARSRRSRGSRGRPPRSPAATTRSPRAVGPPIRAEPHARAPCADSTPWVRAGLTRRGAVTVEVIARLSHGRTTRPCDRLPRPVTGRRGARLAGGARALRRTDGLIILIAAASRSSPSASAQASSWIRESSWRPVGTVVVSALWWLYFDVAASFARRRITSHDTTSAHTPLTRASAASAGIASEPGIRASSVSAPTVLRRRLGRSCGRGKRRCRAVSARAQPRGAAPGHGSLARDADGPVDRSYTGGCALVVFDAVEGL